MVSRRAASQPAGDLPPSLGDILRIVRQAFDELPANVRHACHDLTLAVEDFADDETLDDLEIADPFELTGLYQGVPLTEKSVSDNPAGPDTVFLFRRAILDEWVERGDVALADLVRHVLVHEIAHHLGWSDDDIRAIDDWTE